MTKPDFDAWMQDDNGEYADEICEYVHSIDWLGRLPGPRHEAWLDLAVRAERIIEKPTEVSRNQIAEAVSWARDEGTSWERIGELLGASAAEAEERHGAHTAPSSA